MPIEQVSVNLTVDGWAEVSTGHYSVSVIPTGTKPFRWYIGQELPGPDFDVKLAVQTNEQRPHFSYTGLPPDSRVYVQAAISNMTVVVVRQ